MNKPIQHLAAVSKLAKAHNLSVETNRIIDASAKAQSSFRHAAESIDKAFDRIVAQLRRPAAL